MATMGRRGADMLPWMILFAALTSAFAAIVLFGLGMLLVAGGGPEASWGVILVALALPFAGACAGLVTLVNRPRPRF